MIKKQTTLTAIEKMQTCFDYISKQFTALKEQSNVCLPLTDISHPLSWANLSRLVTEIYTDDEDMHMPFEGMSAQDTGRMLFLVAFKDKFKQLGEAYKHQYEEAIEIASRMTWNDPRYELGGESYAESYEKALEMTIEDNHASSKNLIPNLETIVSTTQQVFGEIKKVLECYHCIIQSAFSRGRDAMELYVVDEGEMVGSIIGGFRNYVKKHHNRIDKQLRHESNRFRPQRTSPLNQIVWAYLYNAEEDAIDAALDNNLLESNDFDYISKDARQKMQDEQNLLCCIKENSIDEVVFNFKDAIENNGLLSVLNPSNVEYFYERVHRRNLIQIGMFPQMREEYDCFLEGRKKEEMMEEEEEFVAEKEVKDEEKRTGVLFSPKAMIYWERLQEAGMINKSFQPAVSLRKASIIAWIMGNKLSLSPLWIPFEQLWSAKELTNNYTQARETNYFSNFSKKIEKALRG